MFSRVSHGVGLGLASVRFASQQVPVSAYTRRSGLDPTNPLEPRWEAFEICVWYRGQPGAGSPQGGASL